MEASQRRAFLRVATAIVGCVGALLALASDARAYCRQSVETDPLGRCMEMEGVPILFWDRGCVTMTFNRNFFVQFPGMNEAQIRGDFEAGFASWREVRCSAGDPPFQVVFAPGVTDTDVAEFKYDVKNESVIAARSYQQWLALDRNPDALALTLLWHNPETGEVMDVDMEFHAGAGRFGTCDQPCRDGTIDLLNAITHEAGHVLGLGHTTFPEATMWKDSDDGENKKRTLEDDDRNGLCALGLSGFDCADRASCQCKPPPVYPSTTTHHVCNCSVPGARSAGALPALAFSFGLLGVLSLRRRVLRRARRTLT